MGAVVNNPMAVEYLKPRITTKSGTSNSSGSFNTGMNPTTTIILGCRIGTTTNGHFDWDSYNGSWWITGLPASTNVNITIAYINA